MCIFFLSKFIHIRIHALLLHAIVIIIMNPIIFSTVFFYTHLKILKVLNDLYFD